MFSIGKGSDSPSLPFPLPGGYWEAEARFVARFLYPVQFSQSYGGKPDTGLTVR